MYLCTDFKSSLETHPDLKPFFSDLATFIDDVRIGSSELPPSKKRKIENIPDRNETWTTGAYSTIRDISFTIPQRKKLHLQIGTQPRLGLRATNTTTGEVEFGAKWEDVEQVICVPVPEKAQPHYNFCVFPKSSADGSPPDTEPILWTVPGQVPKPGIYEGATLDGEGESYKEITKRLVTKGMKGRLVIEPDPKDFVSQATQVQRSGAKPVHVKAFRGSKDGTCRCIRTVPLHLPFEITPLFA